MMKQKRILSTVMMFVITAACIFNVNTFGKDAYNIVVSPQNFVINGEAVSANALNINDYNYIKIAEFAKLLDIDVSYNEITGTVTMDKTKPFDGVRIINAANPYYLVNYVGDLYDSTATTFNGFTLEYVKTGAGLAVVECTGDYKAVKIEAGEINNKPYVFFSIYNDVKVMSNILYDMTKAMPVYDGVVQHPDNDETRKDIANYYRVYINGKQIYGDLDVASGNADRKYRLFFDIPFLKNIGDTLRIEVGN